MSAYPQKLERTSDDALRITWSDGQRRAYAISQLRAECPCASCREKRRGAASGDSGLPVLSLAEAQPTRITAMQPVGNYAYSITFSDGHNTGIFTLELLRELGHEVPVEDAEDASS